MSTKHKPIYHIGIDGGRKTGIAVWNAAERKFESIQTSNFWDVYDTLNEEFAGNQHQCTIWIEDVEANSGLYAKRYDPKSVRLSLSIAQDVGRVKENTHLLIEGLERSGFTVRRIPPRKGGTSKMKAEAFQTITGYTQRTSEHGRDAAMLVFQR